MQSSFKILFDQGKPKDPSLIRNELLVFSETYSEVTKIIIDRSLILDEKSFRQNVATLMPSFGMTRRGVFHGMRVEKDIAIDSDCHVLDVCWTQFGNEFLDLKEKISKNASYRSRAILELPNNIFSVTADLFDKLEWTKIDDSSIGRVGASKILFSILPEIALPVDNSEWDSVFSTHYYAKILQLMIDEIRLWENKSSLHLETLASNSPATLPSVYNVMAMAARPKPKRNS